MKLTDSNYHTIEANKAYWSVSQYKAFRNCQASAMAELTGEYVRPKSEAFIQGGYVDAYFSGTAEVYKMNHPEMINTRSGELKAAYRRCDEAIERAERDDMFREYVSGQSQVIMTGELFGKEWKIKIDSLHEDKIVDLKYMRDMKSVYTGGEWKPFVQAYGYDIQGFVYQAIVEQVTGKHLPFYLAVITKEDPADIEIIHIPDKILNVRRGEIQHYLPELDAVKQGKVEPVRCGSCEYCRKSKVLTEPVNYLELIQD